MRVQIRQGDQVLQRFANGLGALGEYGARKVMVRAINRTGGPALTAVRRELARQTSAPMALIRRQVTAKKAWAGLERGQAKLEFVIQASGRPLPLRHFAPREFKFGVRAKVWGRFQRFEGTFIRGGRWPQRVDFQGGTNNVFVRTSKARLPIERVFGPSLPKELVTDSIVRVFDGKARTLEASLSHELDRELTRFVD